MKKIFVLIATLFAMFITNVANAQWEEPRFYKADELKGEDAYYSNCYISDDGAFVCWSNEDTIKIISDRGIFDYHDSYVKVIVGFYENNNLIEKVTTKFFVPERNSSCALTSDFYSKGLGKKIINHLKNKGEVRFIASKFRGADFDMTVPMNKNIKHD